MWLFVALSMTAVVNRLCICVCDDFGGRMRMNTVQKRMTVSGAALTASVQSSACCWRFY